MGISLKQVTLPDFGLPEIEPQVPRSTFEARLAAFEARRNASGLDAAIFYADREHFANFHWLTGFDPRFEEALLILTPTRRTILTGPENVSRARAGMVEADVVVYPPFGLLGQDRTQTPPLDQLYANAGIIPGMQVGIVGWKYFSGHESRTPSAWVDAPAYLMDELRAVIGSGRAVNATALMMHATEGLRVVNDIDQLAQFEFAGTHASEYVRRVLLGLRPGMRELEASTLFGATSLPISAYGGIATGPRVAGLVGPSNRVIEPGDPAIFGYAVWGGLSGKVGWMAKDKSGMPAASANYVEEVAMPYFACSAEWHETVGIGVAGGTLDALARRHIGGGDFNLILNPGHLIGNDEWLNTPVYKGSTETLRSGQALQVDIIAAMSAPYMMTTMEDGIALLDERGRAELADRYPETARRIGERRRFLSEVVGIDLRPDVLSFSNLPAVFAPYLLSPDHILVKDRA